jgi:acetoin utilization protein AcuB
MHHPVHQIMTRQVVTVDSEATIESMRLLFERAGFHHLLVVEGGRVVGVVSDRDLLRHLSPWAGTLGESRSDAATLRKKAHQVMSRNIVSVGPDASIEEAVRAMLDARVSCVPVLDDERRHKGILTWRDILRWLAEHLEASDDADTATRDAA